MNALRRQDPWTQAFAAALGLLVLSLVIQGIAPGGTVDDIGWFLFLAALLGVVILVPIAGVRALRRRSRADTAR
jgi:hypothetical protein